jgi:2'-5' RNA ligase
VDVRTFIAIELPTELKKHIYDATKPLRDVARGVKWVEEENLHITLKFLGSTPETLLPEMERSMKSSLQSHRSFDMSFAGVGAFPGGKRPPRVVWVGVQAPDEVRAIQRDIEAAMVALDFEADDRPYSPHLTIGRVKQPPRGGLLRREMESMGKTVFGEMRLSGISLMKSTLRPSGAVYERLFNISLSG